MAVSSPRQVARTARASARCDPTRPQDAWRGVAGVGMSAGGIASVQSFLRAVRPGSGVAFVVVAHPGRDGACLTPERLRPHTSLPIVEVRRDTRVEGDHVYVAPAGADVIFAHGELRLARTATARRLPIDRLLRSLAEDQRERAVGIVFGGTDGDGAEGVAAIHAAGGLTMVETPERGRYDRTPDARRVAGAAAHVLAPDDMPGVLLGHLRHRPARPAREDLDPQDDLGTILAILRTRAELDFAPYKQATIRRRVLERMRHRHVASMSRYATELRQDADELRALGRDLLASVTSFFRDPAAWQSLDRLVVAPLVDAAKPGTALRVWVPGCATGEEAYSIAMLLLERLDAAGKRCELRILATDVDPVAIEVGRHGVYPESIVADVTPARLERFFVREDRGYRVSRRLREAVLFARHDVLTDPPFARLDLVSCRNLLAHLEAGTQERVRVVLHSRLVDGGYLFLGSAESMGTQARLFEPLCEPWRIHRRIGRVHRTASPSAGDGTSRASEPGGMPGKEQPATRELEQALEASRAELRRTIEQLQTANEDLRACDEELTIADQELQASNRMLNAAQEEVRHLNVAVSSANARLESTLAELGRANDDLDNLLASTDLATILLDAELHVRRFTAAATRLCALVPSDVGRPLDDIMPRCIDPDLARDARAVVAHRTPSRKEVRTDDGRRYLREALPYRTRDQRVDGVVITFSDAAPEVLEEARRRAQAIVETVHEGLVVLDPSLRVVAANPAFCAMIGADPTEVRDGHLSAIGHAAALDVPALRAALASTVGGDDAGEELEIRCTLPARGDRVLRVHTRALETATGRPQLALLVVEDVTERKRHEEALQEREATTRAILAATADGIVTGDAHGVVQTCNAAAAAIFGLAVDDMRGQRLTALMPPSERDDQDAHGRRCPKTGLPRIMGRSVEVVGRRKDGTTLPLDLLVNELHDGTRRGFVAVMRDITERKRAEARDRRHEAELTRARRTLLAGELGVGIAHEVSQPLATVTNTLAACAINIRTGKATPKEVLTLIDRATRESLRAARIVRHLRDLARGRVLAREDLDLRKPIESAVASVTEQLAQDGIAIQVVLGNNPLRVRASFVEIEQVLLNMLHNAVDALRARRGHRRDISVSATPGADGTVEVAVRDTGVGIPPGDVARLFEPFFTTKPRGLGMGLAICRSIVEAHGGRLWVAPGENRPGATTLRFTIPLVSRRRRSGHARRQAGR